MYSSCRGSFLFACVAAILLTCGCSNESEYEQHQVLNYCQSDEPKRLDPAFVKDLYEGIVSGWIYNGLVQFGQGTEIQPALAERWEVSPDGKTYTFHLRDAKFSDGRPVRPEDVRYSYSRIFWPSTGSDRKWVLDSISGADEASSKSGHMLSGIEIEGTGTVRLQLTRANPSLLTLLAMPNASIIPENAAGSTEPNKEFDRNPIGSGPWVLEKWLTDQRLIFHRNPHYWGPTSELKQLVYQVQVEDTVRYRQFQARNFDIIQLGFQVHDDWQMDAERQSMMKSVQELRTDYVGIMNSKPYLANPAVRQALTSAIDRERIFNALQKKRGKLAVSNVPPGIEGYRERPQPWPRDLDKAKRLLAESGVEMPVLNFFYREEALNGEIVRSVQEDLAAIGVEVQPMPRDQAALRQSIHEGVADLYLGSWTLDYPDMENALYPTYHSRNIPRQGNGCRFNDPEVDRLLDAARMEADGERRIELFQQAEDQVVELCPWIPLFHRETYYAVQSNVSNWEPALIYNADRFNAVAKTPR